MGLLFPDPPTPPNPFVTSALQTGSNIATASANSVLNNVNQYTPQGNLEYQVSHYFPVVDENGISRQIPVWNATQTQAPWYTAQDPEGWSIDTMNHATQYNLGRTSKDRSYALMNMGVFDPFTGAPDAGDPNALVNGLPATQYGWGDVGDQQRSIGPFADQVTGFGDAGAIRRGYGPADDFSSDRLRVENALFERMNPQLLQDEQRLQQQLADQGIRYGTPAYDNAMRTLTNQRTDARLAVTAAGGAEQQRMMDMAAQEAGFENAAQQQAYQQLLGRAGFTNQAQLEQFQKDLQAGNFANEAQKNAFTQAASRTQFANAAQAQELSNRNALLNAQNAERARYMNERYQARSQPINEINALQSGTQLAAPNFVSTANNQIANTDIAGIINNRFSQDMDIYKQNNQNINNIIGGLFGLAGAGAKAVTPSDRRVKKNIHRVGTVFAARKHDEPAKKLPIYEYAYKDDPAALRHVGPMAQDVEKIDPGAVTTRGGVKHIYPKRVMGDILRVA